jgi:hypothetical protein
MNTIMLPQISNFKLCICKFGPCFVCFAEGGPIIDENGYSYNHNYTMKNGNKTWRCCKKKSKECKAYIVTENGWIKERINYHNH